MDGGTGVQTFADIWKWTEDVYGKELRGDRNQGECFSPPPRSAPVAFIVPLWF